MVFPRDKAYDKGKRMLVAFERHYISLHIQSMTDARQQESLRRRSAQFPLKFTIHGPEASQRIKAIVETFFQDVTDIDAFADMMKALDFLPAHASRAMVLELYRTFRGFLQQCTRSSA